MKSRIQKITILTIVIYSFITPYVNAGIVDTGKKWLEAGQQGTVYSSMSPSLINNVSNLSGLLFALGVAVAVIVVAILGIKFMAAGASSDSKANVKQNAIIVAVGIFVLFGALAIWKIVVGVLSAAT